MNPRSRTAQLPPPGLADLDPSWSKLVSTHDGHGIERTWHVLDSGGGDSGGESVRGTVLCVHGNPNWSYMWRGLAHRLTDWRVIAVDALNMGFSERTGEMRRFEERISDLAAVTDALDIEGPVITVAHDWGGPISMGWAQRHVDQLAGIVLMNTGVARPEQAKVPPLISIARATLRATCETTPTFLHGALRMARPQLSRDVYRGYAAPYRSAAMRTGIRDFVDDIPIDETHESFEALADVASGLQNLQHVPALLLWGAKDIIFSDMFLHDMVERLPQAQVHRYADAGHQIIEDTDAIEVIDTWIDQHTSGRVEQLAGAAPSAVAAAPMWAAMQDRSSDRSDAIIEMNAKDSRAVERSISFEQLDERVQSLARALLARGIAPGDRLATLVPPGIDLTVLIYACLRAGIVVVVPDAALGPKGLARALKSSRPAYVVGDWRGLTLAKALRLPAQRLPLEQLLASADDAGADSPEEPSPDDLAAVVFTSGSTGPSKGVRYTHGQLQAQRDAIRAAFEVEQSDRLVVAFAPFAVLAPALGITSVVPPMDVTAPAKLEAQTVADAAQAIDATILFASPAVLANIVATSADLDTTAHQSFASIRLVATAGAPVSPQLVTSAQLVFPNAQFSTPYGMTEVMPVTVASSSEIDGDDEAGVCVGKPLTGVDVAIAPPDAPSGTLPPGLAAATSGPTSLGEVWVRANHASQEYDRLWAREQHAFVDGWHRSGDVGHLDAHGRLWIEGRVDHLIHAATGTVAPVQIELQAESVAGVDRAVAVGVGPTGTQQLAVVIEGESVGSAVVAEADLTAAIRAAVSAEVAAVLVAPKIPVDRRHNSKIDRTRVQRWAEAVLSGRSPRRI